MRRLLCFFSAFVFSLVVLAQENYLLWEVRSSKNKLKGYVYGTVHSADSRLTSWDNTFLECFKKCKYVAGELKMEDVKSFSMSSQMSLLYMNDTLLTELLDSNQYKMVMDTLHKYSGMPEDQLKGFNKMRPSLISITLQAMRASEKTIDLAAEEEVSEFQNGVVVDEYIQIMAKEHDKEVFGLETIDKQLAALYGGSLKEQAEELYLSILKPVKKVSSEVMGEKQMVEKYLEQDLYFFSQLLSSDYVTERLYRDLFLNRNISMVDSMLALMDEKKTFVAIGAGHLAGEYGVVTLLRKKGYTVTPVPFQFTY